MKKNAMLKIAAILMVAVLLTTCAISSTFAKYVSTDAATDAARVAKWGVVVDVTADAFEQSYADNKVKIGTTDENIDLVAPGTSKVGAASVSITGQPEVMVKVDVNTGDEDKEYVDLSGWMITVNKAEVYYCPLKITVKTLVNGETKSEEFYGLASTTLEAYEKSINDHIKAYLETGFEANLNANTELNKVLTIDWAWDFEGKDDKQTDVKDSLLGDNPTANTIAFNFNVSVSQVEPK